ncbi:alpha/beta hydrolase-fold protein [Amnibacterium sp.]|uniref:alpha/beta hydrolase n=1 Tax=Amnibacterium sp. TaxID=1872496 RepID=UPI0026305F98|nr:alpha/beta hydrolase-fold protein [Amnibacterium sp.]MCU1473617.1 phospholipase [Amnibacterium sp.]
MRIDDAAAHSSGPADADSLLLLLHGRGADEHDLLPLAEALHLPDRVVALRGPVPWQGGRAWAERTADDGGGLGIQEAASAVLEWLDREAAAGRGAERIRLLGFSQGGAVALQLLRTAPARFSRTVVLSGFVAMPDGPADTELRRLRPAVFWGRGAIDPVIPASAIDVTRAWLERHATFDERVYPMLGHGVAEAELADVAAFLGG